MEATTHSVSVSCLMNEEGRVALLFRLPEGVKLEESDDVTVTKTDDQYVVSIGKISLSDLPEMVQTAINNEESIEIYEMDHQDEVINGWRTTNES